MTKLLLSMLMLMAASMTERPRRVLRRGFRFDEAANVSENLMKAGVSLVVGFVALAIVVDIQTGDILANASALTMTVVSFVPVIFALGILWVTWKGIIV